MRLAPETSPGLTLRSTRACACVSKGGVQANVWPSFEMHRFAMLLRMRSEDVVAGGV
jgi:hypothetical protein